MNSDSSICFWKDMYRAAILEDDNRRLLDRIRIAKSAIRDRIEELHESGSSERMALNRAWKALHALEEIHTLNSAKAA